ncbi:hypothetical protein PBCVNY2B_449R [Paramecium bursaria Chlorella virus NY2B]|nr:hypothetical protein PBCVNY2B_449R [Paramecium bursaria Chlorella virus NY2B]
MIDYHVKNWIELGVDFIFLDLTNGTQPEILDAADKLCARMAVIGGPRIVFWIKDLKDAKMYWDRYYNKYTKDLFYNHLGKPLLLVAGLSDGFSAAATKPKPIPTGGILDKFTVRWMWALIVNPNVMWSYKTRITNAKPFMWKGRPEQMGVTFAAQTTYMTEPNNGRRCKSSNLFQQQVANMKKYNPQIVTIGSYNEWAAQHLGKTGGPPQFTDTYLSDCNADIEPMAGGYGAKYFKMTKDFIRSWAPNAYS